MRATTDNPLRGRRRGGGRRIRADSPRQRYRRLAAVSCVRVRCRDGEADPGQGSCLQLHGHLFPWNYDAQSEANTHDLFRSAIYSVGVNYLGLPAGRRPGRPRSGIACGRPDHRSALQGGSHPRCHGSRGSKARRDGEVALVMPAESNCDAGFDAGAWHGWSKGAGIAKGTLLCDSSSRRRNKQVCRPAPLIWALPTCAARVSEVPCPLRDRSRSLENAR
jgi:hypothetical protein